MKRKLLSVLLALVMILSLAASVSAEENYTSGDWSYTIYDGKATLKYYNGSATEVVVPATIDGYEVDSLGWGLTCPFSGVRDTLASVVISEGVRLIERQCFKDCTKLSSVTLPSSITHISTYAFQNCSALTEIELNEGLEGISNYAFLSTGLTSVYIPASVTDIGEEAFGYNGEMSGDELVEGFTIYGYTDTAAHDYANHHRFITFVDMGGCYDNSGRCGDSLRWEFTAATGTLRIYGPGGYMYDYDEAEEIPWFVHMPFIKSAVIESGLEICDHAFSGASQLTTVTMADTVEDIRTESFMDTPKLTEIKLSANLDYIGTGAFCNSGLTSIDLPEGLRSIGTNAFQRSALTAIDIPDSVIDITQGAFYSCADLASVKLPAGLEEIYPLVFEGCTSLRSIDLPEDLIIIGRQAFCSSGLTAIEIPDSVVAIDENAFLWCNDLEYVKLPASLEEVGWRCFSECPKLATVVMPEGITANFGDWFFLDCGSLTDIDFHTAAIIGNGMYQNCDGLTNVAIPSCVTTIGDRAFAYCDQLLYVTVPEDVASVGASAFSNCPKLGAIAFRGDAPAFHAYTFQETTVTCYYPADNATWTEEVLQSYGGTVTWLPYEPLPFTDVPVNSFYFDPVAWAVENGVTTGADATHFNPNGQCLRAQVVTFLWRAEGCPEPAATANPFVDVKETDFYYKAVLWAVENGITNGADATHFNPFGVCNRAQVVTFLHRAKGSPAPESTEIPFTDVPAGQWFAAPVAWAVENGVTNGISATEFGPNTACNRAQVVTFLYRAAMVPDPAPADTYTFTLTSNDPEEEIGFTYAYGFEYKAGDAVRFYAEPWFGYLVEFTSDPVVEGLELRYLGAYIYELTMPEHDLTVHAEFVPAEGSHHTITTACKNGEFITNADYNDDLLDIAKPGEHVLFYIYPDDGCTLTAENVTATANGAAVENFWFLGEFVDEYPEDNITIRYFLCELVMPDADVTVSINCTPGTSASEAQPRMNAEFK